MKRIVVTTRVESDGTVHLDLPAGSADPDAEVQVTVEKMTGNSKRVLLAADLLHSGLVGIWAGRSEIGDSLEFAQQLRLRAQTRGR